MRCDKKKGDLQCRLEHGHEGLHRLPEKHECHWPTCKVEVPPSMWGCKKHWFKLPKKLRDRVWETYVPGQEATKTPSNEYMKIALEIQDWALVNPEI